MTSLVKLVTYGCCALFAIHSFAQQDTLYTKSYDELREIISNKLIDKDTLSALTLVEYHRKRAEIEENVEEIAFGYGRYGYIVGIKGDLDIGVEYLNKAIEIGKQNDLKELTLRAHISKGYIYNSNGNFPASIASYYAALRMAEEMGEYDIYYSLIIRIGWIKSSLEDHRGAIAIMKNGLIRLSDIDIPLNGEISSRAHLQTSLLLNIANAQNIDEQPDSSLYYTKKARELLIMPQDSCYLKTLAAVEGRAFILKNKYTKAEALIKIAINACKPNRAIDTLRWKGEYAKIYLGRKQYRKSINASIDGLKAYPITDDEEKFMADYYKTMAKAYKHLGILDSANFYLEKHINTTAGSSMLSTELTNSFKAQELSTFKKELAVLAEQKAERENLLIYGSIAGSTIILLLVLGLVNSNKKRKENEQKFNRLLEKVNIAKAPKEIIDTKDEVLEEQSTSDVNPETTQQILEGLKKLEDQNYFLHPACSAHNVAKRIKTNTTYLSKVINAEFGKNFSTYVNDLRINYAIVRLKQDSKFRSYTISSIATELGYKSADSFTKYFKKDTGLLPSFYIKKLNETV